MSLKDDLIAEIESISKDADCDVLEEVGKIKGIAIAASLLSPDRGLTSSEYSDISDLADRRAEQLESD